MAWTESHPKNPFPYMPLWINDFMEDENVEAMNTVEVGAYCLILFKLWKHYPVATLPSDDALIARWARLSSAAWSQAKPAVIRCFKTDRKGRLYQKRMKVIYQQLMQKRREESERGRKGAAAKIRKEKDLRAQALLEHSGGSAIQSQSQIQNHSPHGPPRGALREKVERAKKLSLQDLQT